jgi:hypothetical protein
MVTSVARACQGFRSVAVQNRWGTYYARNKTAPLTQNMRRYAPVCTLRQPVLVIARTSGSYHGK